MQPAKATHVPADGKKFFDLIEKYLDESEVARVAEAFELAKREHGDERRKSGEPFYTHPLTVAYYMAQYRLDAPALVAALLHDVAEDTRVSVDEIEAQFGADVSHVVDGVTKLDHFTDSQGKHQPLNPEEKQNATLLKLFEAMAIDVRVVLVKLFDRLHNMQTIDSMKPEKQLKKAHETLSVYAPLASRLGMWDVKRELQDLAIRVTDPFAYQLIEQRINKELYRHQKQFPALNRKIATYLTENNIVIQDLRLGETDIYSELRAFQLKHAGSKKPVTYKADKAIRITLLVEEISDCYLALGYLHQLWRPVKNSFDDYIAAPNDHLYLSLHTTLLGDNGQHIKLHIRTKAMDVIAKTGVLARWAYKDSPLWSKGVAERVEALSAAIQDSISAERENPAEGVQRVVEDVISNQIIVFTPQSDALELSQGATALDFAYAIHTGLGHSSRSALINGDPALLSQTLEDGDRVQIISRRYSRPERHWLDENLGFLKTNRSKSHVRRWFRRLSDLQAIGEGAALLRSELATLGMPDYPHAWLARMLGFNNATDFYFALGHAELLTTTLATKLLQFHWDDGIRQQVGSQVEAPDGEKFIILHAGNRRLRLCHMCNPRPGNAIVGFVRTNGRVTVHCDDCHVLPTNLHSNKTLKLSWLSNDERDVRLIKLRVEGYDRAGLIFETLALIQTESINITWIEARGEGRSAFINLEMMANSPSQLVRILHRVKALVNVNTVRLIHDKEIVPRQEFSPTYEEPNSDN